MDQPTCIKVTRGQDGNEEFGHRAVSLQENHTWERPFLPEQQLGQINQHQDDLKDHPTARAAFSHRDLQALWEESFSNTPVIIMLEKEVEVLHGNNPRTLGLVAESEGIKLPVTKGLWQILKEFFHLVYCTESATAATQPWSLLERDKAV